MKTNPWLLVLDLIESEAVPAKQSSSNIQHLRQQVRAVKNKLVFCLTKIAAKPAKTSAPKQQKH